MALDQVPFDIFKQLKSLNIFLKQPIKNPYLKW